MKPAQARRHDSQTSEPAGSIRRPDPGEELLERTRDLEALARAGVAIGSSMELEQVAGTIVEEAVGLVGGCSGLLRLLDDAGGWKLVAARGLSDAFLAQAPVPPGQSAIGRALVAGQPAVIEDVAQRPDLGRQQALLAEGVRFVVSVPLLVGGHPRGHLVVHGTQPRAAGEGHVSALTLLAEQAALAIEHARLYRESEERGARLAALIRAGIDVTSSLDIDAVLQRLVENACGLIDGRSALLRVLAPHGGWELRGHHGLSKRFLDQAPVPLGASPLIGRAIRDGEVVRVEDLEMESRVAMRTPMLDEGIRSLVAVPLRVADRPLGLLAVHMGQPHRFGDDEVSALTLLAEQAALAIEHARLYRESEEQRALLAEQAVELEAFSYSVAHDLRAPLRAMDGFARILVEEHAAALPEEGRRYLQIVCDNARQMGRLVDDLLAFSRLGRQPLHKQPVEPAEAARRALEDLAPEQEGRQVKIRLDELPTCAADPALLKEVYANLLSNALKYTRRREVARIEVGWQPQDGQTAYFVRDNGVGFDMLYADKLFGVFQRLHRQEAYEGTGVGLAIVQRIVHRHGGRVWAEAAVDQGATFWFTLAGPAAPESEPRP